MHTSLPLLPHAKLDSFSIFWGFHKRRVDQLDTQEGVRRRLGSPAHLTRLLPLQKCWRGSVGGGRRRRRGKRGGGWVELTGSRPGSSTSSGGQSSTLSCTYTFKVKRGEIKSKVPCRWLYGRSEKCKFVACMKIGLCLKQNFPIF